MAARKPKTPASFSEARERLDGILQELEEDAHDVDKLAARIREASELLRFCRERLSAARQEVQQVVAELDAGDDLGDAGPSAPSHSADSAPDDEVADDGSAPPEGLPF